MISVLILTLNEEANVADCIATIPWRDDICVLDSNSTDRTAQIAISLGAHVTERAFTNYADQRNFGLALPFANEWIVMIDADERLTPELANEIESTIAAADQTDAMFCVRRKDIFMGRWLRRSSGYPTWFPRVFRRGRARVERAVNESYACDGRIRQLNGHLLHYPLNKGVDWWYERHGRYSSGEADLLLAKSDIGDLLRLASTNPLMRRAELKRLTYSMPGRPFLLFLYLYIFRLGFLDGRPGYVFAMMRMAYEIMIDTHYAFKSYSCRSGAGNTTYTGDRKSV